MRLLESETPGHVEPCMNRADQTDESGHVADADGMLK
jgi:hypothetical protein